MSYHTSEFIDFSLYKTMTGQIANFLICVYYCVKYYDMYFI